MTRHSTPFILTVLAIPTLLTACGSPLERVEITQTENRSQYRDPIKVDASSDERFALALEIMGQRSPTALAGAEPMFHWQTPEGWQEQPSTQFRMANFRIGPGGEGEAYLSVLPGGGGSAFDNVNRWRGQMGLEPYSREQFESLPTTQIFGRPAVLLDFEGAYTPMAQGEVKEGYRMVGALLEAQGMGIFVKMLGPAEIVARERENFDRFLASLHVPEPGHTHPAETSSASDGDLPVDHPPIDTLPPGHPPVGDLPPGHPPIEGTGIAQLQEGGASESSGDIEDTESAQGFRWKAPEGWQRSSEGSSMRLVTYRIGENQEAECFVTLLAGSGGGAANNINRWRGELGQSTLSEDEINVLPKISVLGEETPFVKASGAYLGMTGETKPGQMVLGVARILPLNSVFVKMLGPEAVVKTQEKNFIAFCESLDMIEE